MSNNKYKVNKYTLSILDGLGYDVILGDGLQGVTAIKDRRTDNYLPQETVEIVNFTDEEWLSGMYDLYGGVITTEFTGFEGEKISLNEFGETEIYFGKDLVINLSKYDEKTKRMNISIKYGEEKPNNISFRYEGFTGNDNVGIFVEDLNRDSDSITSVYCRENSWGDYRVYNSPEDCTSANIVNQIITALRRYRHGSCWDDDLKYGLEVIGPALDHYALDFRHDWVSYLDGIVDIEKESQKEEKKAIERHINNLVNSKVRVDGLKGIKTALLDDPDVKLLYKKRNENKTSEN